MQAPGVTMIAGAAVAALALACDNDAPPQMTVEDMEWLAFVDGDDPGEESYDDEPRLIRLSDYYASNQPGTRIIMLSAATGWCAPCQAEAAAMSSFAADYEPRGVAILTAVFQNADSEPADVEFTRLWAETFSLTIPVVVDAAFATGTYFDQSAMPSTMLVDADTLEILAIKTGAEVGPDPLAAHRDLLDYYLSQP